MGSFEVVWKSSAERDLRGLDRQHIGRVVETAETLKNDLFPPQCRKLRGSELDYRVRVGDFRVIYQMDTAARLVTVYHVRHRSEAYR